MLGVLYMLDERRYAKVNIYRCVVGVQYIFRGLQEVFCNFNVVTVLLR